MQLAPNTIRDYQRGQRYWEEFCSVGGHRPYPGEPEALAKFIHRMVRRHKVATVRLWQCGINWAHRQKGKPVPGGRPVKQAWAAALHRLATTDPSKLETRHALPLSVADIRAMVDACGASVAGCRDAALILVGFSAALPRTELAQISYGDIDFARRCMAITTAHRKVRVPAAKDEDYCPVRRLRRWIEVAGTAPGEPVFRAVDKSGRISPQALSDRTVTLICKRRAQQIGLDPSTVSSFSLRSGFATSAASAGWSPDEARITTGLSATALARYYSVKPAKVARSLL